MQIEAPPGRRSGPCRMAALANAAQVNAVVQALQVPERWAHIAHIEGKAHRRAPLTLSPRLPWRWLSPDKCLAPLSALPRHERQQLTQPWPDIWIAAGRRSAAFTRNVREWSGGKTLAVQILDPRIAPTEFDL